jgi:hypothetical protein
MEVKIMKKILVLFLLAGYCIAGIASKPASWVTTKDGRIDTKKLAIGISRARIITTEGKKVLLPLDQINAYALNGKVYQKMPLYKDGKPTGKTAFMELIKTRSGLGIYQYVAIAPSNYDVYKAYVYKGDKLQLELDAKSLPNACNFFAVKGVVK